MELASAPFREQYVVYGHPIVFEAVHKAETKLGVSMGAENVTI